MVESAAGELRVGLFRELRSLVAEAYGVPLEEVRVAHVPVAYPVPSDGRNGGDSRLAESAEGAALTRELEVMATCAEELVLLHRASRERVLSWLETAVADELAEVAGGSRRRRRERPVPVEEA